ncbi:MAG: tetratricopeptide repeat protein [bacterium]|nr:tetratricopeptide repeat protein [bacterium]
MRDAAARVVRALLVSMVIFTPLAYGTVETRSITVLHATSIVIALVWLLPGISRGRLAYYRTPFDLPLLLLLLIVGLSAWFSVYSHASRIQLFRWINYGLIFFVVMNTFDRRRKLTGLVWAIVLFGSAYAVAALLLADQQLPGLWNFSRGAHGLSLTFVNPNHFAGYLAMVVWLGAGLALAYRGARRALLLFLSAYLAVAVVFSLSRGGALGLIVSLGFFLLLQALCREERRQLWVAGALVLLVVLLTAWLGVSPFLERLQELRSSWPTGDLRKEIWLGTLSMISDSPWLGTGPGTYAHAYGRYQTELTAGHFVDHAHNDYLEVTAEIGLPGFLVASICIAGLFGTAIRKLLGQKDRHLRVIGFGALTSCFGLLVHSAVEFNFYIPANALLFTICAALALLAGSVSRRGVTLGRGDLRLGKAARWAVGGGLLALAGLSAAAVVSSYAASVYEREALKLREGRDHASAAAALENAIRFDPGNADLLLRLGEVSSARAGLEAESPEARESLLGLSLHYYEKAVQACPVAGRYHFRKGRVLERLGRVDDAVQAFEQAIYYAPVNALARYRLGRIYLRRGEREQGYEHLERSLELREDRLDLVLDEIWELTENPTELKRVVPLRPGTRKVLAHYLLAKGETQAALEELATTFSLEPTLINALAHVDAARGHSRALQAAKTYRERFGQEIAWRKRTALIYSDLDRFDEAIGIYKSLLADDSDQVDPYLALSQIYRKAGRPREAVETLRSALKRRPQAAVLHASLAAIYRTLEAPEEELQAWKRASFLEPASAEYRYQVGLAYERRGMFQEAVAAWEDCLDLDPRHQAAESAIARVIEKLKN